MSASVLVEHFFRHEYGRLVAMLSRRVGVEFVVDVEDAVQTALMAALEHWTVAGLPDNPSAWLFRTASNQLLGDLRRQTRRRRILQESVAAETESVSSDDFADESMQDDLLRMLFVCCDEAIPIDSQLVFALKTLCGFDVREISLRLFTTEANVYQRLRRARLRLQQVSPDLNALGEEQFVRRLSSVHRVLYLLFTEGYLSSDVTMALRRELCEEALRLGRLLAEYPHGRTPETCALLALMRLHLARMAGRQDSSGDLLLLEEQDRSLWDQEGIQAGLAWLARSAEGETFSRYHAEAGIAAEHCLAENFQATRWDKVAEYYQLLEQFGDSPIHRLNRAVAVAEWQGPCSGLALLEGVTVPEWLANSYLWTAVLADLHRRSGNQESALHYTEMACRNAPTPQVKQLLVRRLGVGG